MNEIRTTSDAPVHAERAAKKVVVIGASAGGLTPLIQVVSGLPPDFAAAVCIVQHLSATYPSSLDAILARSSLLRVRFAREGDVLAPGHVYIAPPDCHLLIGQLCLHLSRSPRQNHWRPSIDALFRSAAHCYGAYALGVVLSGAMYDGAAGLAAIAAHRGATIVQAPEEAQSASMPQRALRAVRDARVSPANAIAPVLMQWVEDPRRVSARWTARWNGQKRKDRYRVVHSVGRTREMR